MTRQLFTFAFVLLAISSFSAVQQKSLSVLFETDKHELTADAVDQLKCFINTLSADDDFDIALSGHTDNIGNSSYNDALAARRAAAVKAYLLANGVSKNQITDASFGETKPYLPNSTDRNRDFNRRVEVNLTLYHFDSVDELEQTLTRNKQSKFEIDPSKKNIINGTGVNMLIEPNTFVDANGNLITEKVEIELLEALKMDDFLSNNLATLSGDQLLVSGGMFQVTAKTASGTEVQISPDQPITTVVAASQVEQGMQLFTSDGGQDWSLTDSEITTMLSIDMPPYPRMNFIGYQAPRYNRDLSTRPVEPVKRPRPKAPKTPSVEDYKTDIVWYQIPFKKSIARSDRDRYLAEMDRYQKNFDMYQRRYDLYVEHSSDMPEKLRQYKLDMIAWNKKCTEDSIQLLNSTEYLEAKNQNVLLYAQAKEKHQKKIDAWLALRQEKMGALAAKMDSMGVTNEQAVNSYIFTMSKLRWINIDRFYKIPANATRAITLKDKTESSERVFIVFKNINSMLPMQKGSDGRSYEMEKLPKTEKAVLMAYRIVDGKPEVYIEDVHGKKSRYEMKFEPYTFKELKSLLSEIQS